MVEKKVGVVWLPLALLLGGLLAAAGLGLARRTQPAPIRIDPPPPTPTAAPTDTPRPLRVYVSGAVRQPDVYELPAGSIVADAVQAAGDFAAAAAPEMVNLARPLSDGMHVHVPAEDEEGLSAQPAIIATARPAGAQTINVNAAGMEELQRLPGVGPATAQNILNHRRDNGPFTQIEDIMDVSGIGPAKFEQMKELITID